MAQNASSDDPGVSQEKEEKGWKQSQDRFPDATYVQGHEQQDESELQPELVRVPLRGKEAEQGIAGGRYRIAIVST